MGSEHKEYTWRLIAKRLNGEATPDELRELEDLLRSNPELHYPMQTVTDLWNSHNPQDQELAEQAFSRHLDRMQGLNIDYNPLPADPIEFQLYPIKNNNHKRSWLIAAAATVIVATSFIWIHGRRAGALPAPVATVANAPSLNGNDIFTGNGSRTHLVLPDGTVVWLNAGSRINYEKNFGVADRVVNLTGEAFFDVASNANKPFTIHTARIDIRVLGTRFNVKSYPTDRTTETTLIGGSIEVSIKNRPSNKIILKPNEKLVIQNEDSVSQEEIAKRREPKASESLVRISKPTYEQRSGAIIETSWVDNKLVFQDEPFIDLAKRMERWYGVTIHFDSPRQEALHFTGNFEKETIQQALEALKLTANFNYTIEENQITINER